MAQSKIEEIEREKGKPMREVLLEMYPSYGSQTALAKALGVTQGTISLWLMRFNLEEKKVLTVREN